MERELLACALHSRQDYEQIAQYIPAKSKSYSPEFQAIYGKISEWYDRDSAAQSVAADVLSEQMASTIRSEKALARLSSLISDAAGVSVPNVMDVVLAAKRQEVGDKLAAALVSGEQSEKIDELLEQYNELKSATSLDAADDDDVMIDVDLTTLLTQEYDPTNVIELYPKSLNDRLDGGAKKGHHVTVFARPNIGKTAFTVNTGSGVARQGKRVMHLINEDRKEDVYLRYVCNLSGMDKHSVRDNPSLAQQKAGQVGLSNVIVIAIKPGTPEQIKRLIQKYQPDVVIVDQLRNLQVKADSRVNQLESAATAMRNIGKQENVLMISVTQAGDSARDKLVLDDGDIDFSNTGIPAQADLLIGIGCNEEYKSLGQRILNLIKNKIGAIEEHFPVKIVETLSRYVSI